MYANAVIEDSRSERILPPFMPKGRMSAKPEIRIAQMPLPRLALKEKSACDQATD